MFRFIIYEVIDKHKRKNKNYLESNPGFEIFRKPLALRILTVALSYIYLRLHMYMYIYIYIYICNICVCVGMYACIHECVLYNGVCRPHAISLLTKAICILTILLVAYLLVRNNEFHG